MPSEYRLDDFFFVLRADGKHDPALGQRHGEALEGRIGLARGAALSQDKSFDAVVAHDAAPERVIEIEDQAFTREPARGRDNPSHEIAVKRRNKGPDSLFRLMPVNRIAPRGAPGPCRLTVHVDQENAGGRCRVGESLIETVDQRRGRARNGRFVASKERKSRVEDRLLEDDGAKPLTRAPPQNAQRFDLCVDCRVGLFPRRPHRHRRQRGSFIENEKREIGPASVEEGVAAENHLAELTIRRNLNIENEAAVERGDADRRDQMLDGRGGHHR